MSNLQLVGISGKIGTGKDYISQTYLRPKGYHQWSLAWHFKIWIIGKGDATFEELFHTKPPHIRKLLQLEGTERGRMIYGESVWTNTMVAWMNLFHESWGINTFVVPDVRFKNEVMAIQEHGGKVLRIRAPHRDKNSGASDEARSHISETDLDDVSDTFFDGIIHNDPEHAGTIEEQLKVLLPKGWL